MRPTRELVEIFKAIEPRIDADHEQFYQFALNFFRSPEGRSADGKTKFIALLKYLKNTVKPNSPALLLMGLFSTKPYQADAAVYWCRLMLNEFDYLWGGDMQLSAEELGYILGLCVHKAVILKKLRY